MNLTVVTLLKRHHTVRGEGDRPFWTTLGADYLAKLTRGVRKHIGDVPMACLTDSPECMPEGVTALPLLRPEDPAWWNKLALFAPETGLSGRVLYLDLDNVLAGPLDALTALSPAPLIMTDDVHFPGLPNGSVMLFHAEQMWDVWARYCADPLGIQAAHRVWPHAADQGFLAWLYPERPLFQSLLPEGTFLNACEMERGAAWETARLVFGGGCVKPHASRHPFYAEHWT